MCAKRNNPGCQCCKRALIWDVGSRFITSSEVLYYWAQKGAMDDAFEEENITLDRAVPYALLETSESSGGTFGGNFWTNNSAFSPYDDPPENDDRYDDYWTRNINDYRVIFWMSPFASTSTLNSGPCTPPFGTGRNGQPVFIEFALDDGLPDHEYAGGLPDWWDVVSSGAWEGRLIIFTGSNGRYPGGFEGYHKNLFLSDSGVFDEIGLSSSELYSLCGSINPPGTDQCGTTSMAAVGTDLTDGISKWPLQGDLNRVDGGQPLFRVGGYELCGGGWCNFAHTGLGCDWTVSARNRKTYTVDDIDYHKDFIVHTAGSGTASHATDSRRQSDPISTANWYTNLYDVPIEETPSTGTP